MQKKYTVLILGLIIFAVFPNAFAENMVHIQMEKTTFSYGEKLFYIIEVSEVTGDSAIIHIRDDMGQGSSAIPIQISELKTPILSPFAFDKDVFATGKYYIDIEYAGSKDTVEFNLIDSGKIALPFWMRQVAYGWMNDDISGGALIDAIERTIDSDNWDIVKENNKDYLNSTHVPNWVKTITGWWLEDKITDDDFAKSIQYLIKIKAITI